MIFLRSRWRLAGRRFWSGVTPFRRHHGLRFGPLINEFSITSNNSSYIDLFSQDHVQTLAWATAKRSLSPATRL